jgi:hypothetical protein
MRTVWVCGLTSAGCASPDAPLEDDPGDGPARPLLDLSQKFRVACSKSNAPSHVFQVTRLSVVAWATHLNLMTRI